jgi:hypothetical protein
MRHGSSGGHAAYRVRALALGARIGLPAVSDAIVGAVGRPARTPPTGRGGIRPNAPGTPRRAGEPLGVVTSASSAARSVKTRLWGGPTPRADSPRAGAK